MKNVLREAILVGAIGLVLAFTANALSRRGLRLTRNYSPGGALASARALANGTGTNVQTMEFLEKQFRAEGLQLADSNRVATSFEESKREPSQVIFVDARDDEHYQAGHIPGAYHLDHYHAENYLAVVLPVCQVAQKIIVYCKGGSCEDSEQTAIFLRDAGISKQKLFVYAGGFDEWTANQMPIENGEQNGNPPQPTGTSNLTTNLLR